MRERQRAHELGVSGILDVVDLEPFSVDRYMNGLSLSNCSEIAPAPSARRLTTLTLSLAKTCSRGFA